MSGLKKISQVIKSDNITDKDYFLGVRDNGDGTYSDFLYSPAQVVGANKKIINVVVGGQTLTDTFFSNQISEIITDAQVYIVGIDFTIDTTTQTITGLTISFRTGQTLIAVI